MELVLKVVARLSTSSHPPDHLEFFVFHLVVELLKFPAEDSQGLKNGHPPMLVNLCAVSDGLVTPNIPARSAANLSSKAFFDANPKVVLVVFHAWVFGDV